MWINSIGKIVGDLDGYTADDGTYYPALWPKETIPDLTRITLVPAPTDETSVVTGWHVGDDNVQVWDTRPKTRDELNAPILSQIAALDAYIPRGLEDLIAGLNFDVTKLPQIQQDRLKQKAALRAQLVAT